MTRRQLFQSFLFIALTITVMAGLSAFLSFCQTWKYKGINCTPGDENRDAKIKMLMEHQLDPEIMIFGSSVALVHYDCAEIEQLTGKSCFNMGLNGNFFPENYGYILEFLSYSSTTEVVLMSETYGSLWRHEGLHRPEYSLTWIDNENIYECLHRLDPERVWRERYLPLFNLTTVSYGTIREGIRNFSKKISPEISPSLCNYGYQAKGEDWKGPDNPDLRLTTYIEPEVVADFIRVIRKIITSGKKAVLVMPPIYTGGMAQIPRLEDARKTFKMICETTGATYLDYCAHPELSPRLELFTNNTHLNPEGAAIFSQLISEDLKKILAD